jgi:predicted ribosomally synthesized peptide with SipW-like signal peptide
VKKTLLLVVAGLLALSVGTAGAYFTDQASVPDNVIRAGTVEVSTVPTSSALSEEGIAPGATYTKQLTISNTGSLDADCVVTAAKKAGYTDFYEALTCVVTRDGRKLYEGPLSALRTAPVRVTAGSSAAMEFAYGLPPTAENGLAGDYVKLTLYVDAEQAR